MIKRLEAKTANLTFRQSERDEHQMISSIKNPNPGHPKHLIVLNGTETTPLPLTNYECELVPFKNGKGYKAVKITENIPDVKIDTVIVKKCIYEVTVKISGGRGFIYNPLGSPRQRNTKAIELALLKSSCGGTNLKKFMDAVKAVDAAVSRDMTLSTILKRRGL